MVAGLGLALSTLAAANSNDPLDRMTPVPKTEPIPVADFVRPTLFSNPELNPAGTHFFASTTVVVDRREIVVCDLATRKYQRLYGPGKKDIRDVDWMGDEHLIFTVVRDNRYSEGLCAAPLHDLRLAYPIDDRIIAHVLSSPRAEPEHPIVWIRRSGWTGGREELGVFQIDGLARSDTRSDIRENDVINRIGTAGTLARITRTYPEPKDGKARGYLTDAAGELAYALTADDGQTRLQRFDGKKWLPCPVDLEDLQIVAVGDQPGQLLVLGPRTAEKPRALHYLDATTGQLSEPVFQDEKYDLAGCRPYRHPNDGRLLGLRYEREIPTTVWFDPVYQKLQRKIEASLGKAAAGARVSIVGSDRAEKRYFVAVRSDTRPQAYFLIDTEKGSISNVVPSVAPWIDPERMRPMSIINYKSRDGIVIDAYLTLPEGASKEHPAPLVVLAHGGPWARDSWDFDGEVQLLASRGYAVFQPNYRGSLGTQWRFPAKDMWAFRTMHEDVTDGVQRLLRSGLIDPDRVAIMGGSFGAYLALCGVTDEPALYRCAVATSGVFDWAQMIAEAKRFEAEGVRPGQAARLRRFLGDPEANRERFESISPIHRAGQIKVPVFIAHGRADPVAAVEQSQRLVAELKKNGVPHETYFQSGEGHGMADLEHRVKLYTAIEAFLAKNLAPRTPAPAANNAPPATAP